MSNALQGFGILFFILGVFGLVVTSGPSALTNLIFLTVASVLIMSAIPISSNSRAALGIPFMFILLFLFTTQYPSFLGQAVFGNYWPQVSTTAENIVGPLSTAFTQALNSGQDAWEILTCPACYYQKQIARQQASASTLTQGGTTQAIEINNFDLLGTTILDPTKDTLISLIELENRGEFDSSAIKVDIFGTWENTSAASNEPRFVTVGQFDPGSITCSSNGANSTAGQAGTCSWINALPHEIKQGTFRFAKDSWKGTNPANGAEVKLGEIVISSDGTQTYKYGGQTVRINANYTFNYNVNVSIPIEILNRTLYDSLLQARQISLQQPNESQYSGGPIKATIRTEKQPVRDNEQSTVIFSIVNEGSGTLDRLDDYSIYVPRFLNPGTILSSTFSGCTEGSGFTPASSPWVDYVKISCNLPVTRPIRSTDQINYRRASFTITPPPVAEKQTGLIVGIITNYVYTKTDSRTVQVAYFPIL